MSHCYALLQKILIIILFVIFYKPLFAQTETKTDQAFYVDLKNEAEKIYLNSAFHTIDFDSLMTSFFNNGKASIGIDTSASWQLLFYDSKGWTHNIRLERLFSLNLDSISINQNHVKKESKTELKPIKKLTLYFDSSKVYSGKELFEKLEINSVFLDSMQMRSINSIWNHKTSDLKEFPAIRERNDPLNRIWVPLISNDLLILRIVHSYPDGNETSFYNEITFYFKKTTN